MVFKLNKKRITTNTLALMTFMVFMYVLLPYWYGLMVNTVPMSLIIVNVFRFRERRFYQIIECGLLYSLSGNEVLVPRTALKVIKKHSLLKVGLYNQYFFDYEGFTYELYEDYINEDGESIVKVLVNDWNTKVERVQGLKLVIKVKKKAK